MTLVGFRHRVVKAIPLPNRQAVAAGMGLFLTIIGLVVMAVLHVRKVPGVILIGILVVRVMGFVTGDVSLPERIIS